MKHLLLLFITLTLAISTAHSQNPGLMGKHYILHYNFDYQIGIYNGGLSNFTGDNRFLRYFKLIQGRHEIGNEYVISRWQSVQADYIFFWGKDFKNDIKYHGHEVAISYKHYIVGKEGGSIAPLGVYWRPKAFVTLARYNPEQNSSYNQSPLTSPESFIQYGASFEFGRQSIVFKKIILDMGMSLGWTFSTKKEVNAFRDEYNGYDKPLGVLFEESPFRYIFLNRLISFRIGFGIPLF